MYHYTIASHIIPKLQVTVDVAEDAPSQSQIVLRLPPSQTPYNSAACQAFREYLEASYDVKHTNEVDGSQVFLLKPLAATWHSSAAEYLRHFAQQMSAYYAVPAETIFEQCTDKTWRHNHQFDHMCSALNGNLSITHSPGTHTIDVTIKACDSQTEFCGWLERLYHTTRTEDNGAVTLKLEHLRGTEDVLDCPTHLIYLVRGMMDAWGFSRQHLVDIIQPAEMRSFVNSFLHMRPHPSLEKGLHAQYGNQSVVVGTGFTGVSIVRNLLDELIKNPPSLPTHITMLERNPGQFAGGLAYGAAGDEHRVNVQAQFLSLDPKDPDDFVRWLTNAKHDMHEGDGRYLDIPDSLLIPSEDPAHQAVQRQLYHHYLLDRLYEAVTEARARGVADVEIIFGEAVAANVTSNTVSVELTNGETVKGNNLVMANGHGPVVVPAFLTAAYKDAPERVIVNQWEQLEAAEALLRNPDIKDVLVLGTGLSAMDVMMTAHKVGFFDDTSRTLTLMSRGGHTHPVLSTDVGYVEPRVDFEKYEKEIPHSVEDVPTFVGRVFADVKESGETAIGRPYSDEETFFALVQHIPRFNKSSQIHLNDLLGLYKKYSSLITTTAVAMAPEIGRVFLKYTGNGRIKIVSANTKAIAHRGDKIAISTDKGDMTADGVISALPPQSDPAKIPIIADLISKGVLRIDPGTGIGLDVTDEYRAIGQSGEPNGNVYVSGPIVTGHVMEKLGLIGPLAQIISGLRPEAALISEQLAEKCYANSRLRVGIVANLEGHYQRTLSPRWIEALRDFGIQAYLINPSSVSPKHLSAIVDNLDGILLPGSNSNLHPDNYGQEPLPGQTFDRERDAVALALIEEAAKRDMPVLGICRGAQELNVAYGGQIDQAICCGHDFGYIYPERMADNAHKVVVQPSGLFAAMYGPHQEFGTTSIHHQGIKIESLSVRLKAEALATDLTDDGCPIVEAFRDPMASFVVGVQYHPEFDPREDNNALLFHAFRNAVERYHISKELAPILHLDPRTPVVVAGSRLEAA